MTTESNDSSDGANSGAGSEAKAPRRLFLRASGLALCGGSCLAVLGPGLQLIAYPIGNETVTGRGRYVAVGDAEQFNEGALPVKVDIVTERGDAWNRTEAAKIGSAWVMRRNGRIHAYSAACPHLGCSVDLTSEAEASAHGPGFICRCHDSFFAGDGSATQGPSPRGLDELEVREVEGELEIRFERFRYGTPEKTPV